MRSRPRCASGAAGSRCASTAPTRPGATPRTCTAPPATSTIASRAPSLFSFNSPLGACETCRGFGRVIGIDYDLVVPDKRQDAARRRDQAVPERVLPRVPGRSRAPRQAPRHPARHALARPERGAARLGHRGRGALEQEDLVRREALLRVAGVARLQDARARAALALPQLHALRRPAAAHGSSPRRCSGGSARRPGYNVHQLMLLPIERCVAFFAALALPAPLDEATEQLLGGGARAARLPRAGRARLPHARPPVADAVGRRGAAHQPDDRARHLAGQHAVRARRALDRPAPARHAARDRRDAPPARRGQLAAGRRARSADHAGGRSDHRPRPGTGRARRQRRLQRHPGRTRARRRTR